MPEVVVVVISSQNIASDQSGDEWFTAANNYPYVPPVYLGDNFAVTLDATLQFEEGESETGWSITNVSITGNTEIFTYTGTVIEGAGGSPFNDYFEFVMPDFSTSVLTVSDARTQGFASLKQWSPPNQSLANDIHTITVDYENNGTPYQHVETKTGNLYFKYEPYTQLVIDLVDEGQF